MVTTLTTKGQVTIPKEVRDQLGLRPGDGVEFLPTGKGFAVRKAARSVLDEWVGSLKRTRGRDIDRMIDQMRGETK